MVVSASSTLSLLSTLFIPSTLPPFLPTVRLPSFESFCFNRRIFIGKITFSTATETPMMSRLSQNGYGHESLCYMYCLSAPCDCCRKQILVQTQRGRILPSRDKVLETSGRDNPALSASSDQTGLAADGLGEGARGIPAYISQPGNEHWVQQGPNFLYCKVGRASINPGKRMRKQKLVMQDPTDGHIKKLKAKHLAPA